MAAGAGYGDAEAATAQCARDSALGTSAIQNDVRRDAASQRAVLVEMAHAAQIAFAFFADVAQKDQRGGQLRPGLHQRLSDGHHAHHASAVVAGSWSLQTVAVGDGMKRGFKRKDCVQMGGKNDHRPGAL